MDKVSIVVPVYNIEKYLNMCVDSILNQTYKNLEVVLVDDGSPDSSGEICDAYAEKDNRVKVIHKENAGAAEARNTGIKNATGKYISFIDSDDKIENNFVEDMLNSLNKYNAELCVCGISDDYIKEGYSVERITNTDGKENLEIKTAIFKMESQGMINSSCNKLYLAEIINKNGIFFDKSVTPGEDLVFNCNYMLWVKSVSFVSKALYHYFKTDEGSLVSRHRADLFDRVVAQQKVRKSLYEFHNMNSAEEKICFANMYVGDVFPCVPNMYRKESEFTANDKKEFYKTLLENEEFLKNLALCTTNTVYMNQFKKLISKNSPTKIHRAYAVLFFFRNTFGGVYRKFRQSFLKERK